MSAIKGKNTNPEITVRKYLWHKGYKGYRLHCKELPGVPDICYPRKKVAIFVHGCFWHRCPYCHPHMPKSHTNYWKVKFNKNVERDKRNLKELKSNDWKVIVLWECQIKDNLDYEMQNVMNILN